MDNPNLSLDEIIFKNNNRPMKIRNHPPSQQWRLGRNGPGRPMPRLKRLQRQGPLRPVGSYGYHHNSGIRSSMPRLVKKRWKYLPATSVFRRLSYKPNYATMMARQRAIRARHLFWRPRPRHYWRPYFQHGATYFPRQGPYPWAQSRPRWQNRRPQWHPHMHPKPQYQKPQWVDQNQEHICNQNDELIKRERKRVQEKNLASLQISYQAAPRGDFESYQQIITQPPPLPDDSAAEEYPIANDMYRSNVPAERAPSPEGSIISTLQRTRNVNPFGRGNASRPTSNNVFGRVNPSVQTSNNTGRSNQAAAPMVNPFMANFRATPTTGQIPFNTRFATHSQQ